MINIIKESLFQIFKYVISIKALKNTKLHVQGRKLEKKKKKKTMINIIKESLFQILPLACPCKCLQNFNL